MSTRWMVGLVALAMVGALSCSDDSGSGPSSPTDAKPSASEPSPAEVVMQFGDAVRSDDLAAIEKLLAPDVVHSEFVQDPDTGERERWAPDIVGSDVVAELYGTQGGPMPPQGRAVIDSPDTEVIDDRLVVQTETLTHSTGFFWRTIVETEVSEAGEIERLSLVHERPRGGIDEPSATEAAAFLDAIYVANGLPAPIEDAEREYAFHRGNPPCQEPEQGSEGNDPEVLEAQLDALASEETPVWLIAAQGLAEARAYCPARFWQFREVVEAAIGNDAADRAMEWATVPIG